MCGIGGILRTDGQPIPEEWLDAIDARIAYRGPDGAGRFRDRVTFTDEQGRQRVVEVAFVHRRLSIIDHKDGHQPMVSERGRNESEGLVAVVFNGCIYNHRELRRELEAKGHRFVTDHSDTEVLIHGWREWAAELKQHLEGMYAFGIWDRANRCMAVCRDPHGEKPLYVSYSGYIFASNPDAFAGLGVPANQGQAVRNQVGLVNLLYYGYTLSNMERQEAWPSKTAPPGSVISVHCSDAGDSFSDGEFIEPGEPMTAASLDELLEQAVSRRLEADVPLGCFLSGGIDSSLIAQFAVKHKPDLRTFTVRMPDTRYDESPYAEVVARHLGTNHNTLDVAVNPAEDLIFLINTLGQPFGDSSILPTYWVSKAARQHVKVALAGDGGDELFLGYERYLAAPRLARYWFLLALAPQWPFRSAHPKTLRSKIGRLIAAAHDYGRCDVSALELIFSHQDVQRLLGPSVRPPLEPQGYIHAANRLRHFDLHHYLPDDLLRKTDTASMACGLEVRCPFLDRDLAAAVLAMPVDELIPNGERKGLLRRIARKYLPKECVDRPKMGFAIPIGEWFRSDDLPHKGSGMKTLLLDHLNSDEPFGPIQLNRKAVQRFIDEHMSGKRDHGQRLFTLLTLSIWARSAG